ncbi:MAG: ABC transporter ATP-binding protein [Anaerolineae bacterium]|nr:ABC transporter ATP-binding protein [Anaerolineae bacterium]
MSVAVEFKNVSKRFILQHARATSFQETLVGLFRRQKRSSENFWVLQDVSFQLEAGKSIGLIGVNGTGKSTVLKLMSHIIQPTAGVVNVFGRVGALLELGAGFHPDLTGRENIYLHSAILGVSREHIQRQLDEIVAFSELEQFIDVPVKHYSSGMYVRLGFAVAVHTEPEILLVDEVLAVGDAAFQHKCLDRIATMRRKGVTIVLVSHSPELIQSFCEEVIWLDGGRVRASGHATDVVMEYIRDIARKEREEQQTISQQEVLEPEESAESSPIEEPEEKQRWGTGKVKIVRVELYVNGMPGTTFETGDPVEIRLHYHAEDKVVEPIFGLAVHHQNGTHICGPNTKFGQLTIPEIKGDGIITYRIPALNLLEGSYLLSVAVVNQYNSETYDYHDRLYPFHVYRAESQELYGIVTLNGKWSWSSP